MRRAQEHTFSMCYSLSKLRDLLDKTTLKLLPQITETELYSPSIKYSSYETLNKAHICSSGLPTG